MLRLRRGEGLIKIGQNVVNVFDADREADHLGPHPSLVLLLQRHLPVRGRSGVAGERFGIAHIDQPLEQLECVVKPLSGLQSACNAKGHQRARASAKIFLRQRVIKVVSEAGVINPRHTRIAVEEFGDAAAVLNVTLDAQCHRLDPLQQEKS